MARLDFGFCVLALVLLGAFQSLASPTCSPLTSSEIQKLQLCNLTRYSSDTYFWDKENCLQTDQQLVTLIETFSDKLWKNKIDYPSSCLEEFVRYSCSQACPICGLPDFITPPQSNSQLDQLYLTLGQGLSTCTDRCRSFEKACNSTPGISALASRSNCTDVNQYIISSPSASKIISKSTNINCTNHNSTLIADNSNISSPEALGYATCDAGFLKTFEPQICTTSQLDQKIWNDRSGENGESTCEKKDASLVDVLPQFVSTFNRYNVCVEDYADCLDAYANFVCSMSCPFCSDNKTHSAPCKSQCEAIVASCAGLPVLGITARMNCTGYSVSSCTEMSSKGVPTIIEENASTESIECPQKNETDTTPKTRASDEEIFMSHEANVALIHQLLNYRHQDKKII